MARALAMIACLLTLPFLDRSNPTRSARSEVTDEAAVEASRSDAPSAGRARHPRANVPGSTEPPPGCSGVGTTGVAEAPVKGLTSIGGSRYATDPNPNSRQRAKLGLP